MPQCCEQSAKSSLHVVARQGRGLSGAEDIPHTVSGQRGHVRASPEEHRASSVPTLVTRRSRTCSAARQERSALATYVGGWDDTCACSPQGAKHAMVGQGGPGGHEQVPPEERTAFSAHAVLAQGCHWHTRVPLIMCHQHCKHTGVCGGGGG